MKITVYTLEDFRPDYDHGVIGVYGSFEKAKKELISVLKESIMFYQDELDECEDAEYAEWLRDFIARLEEEIKKVEKATPVDSFQCYQFYITKDIVKVD